MGQRTVSTQMPEHDWSVGHLSTFVALLEFSCDRRAGMRAAGPDA